MKEDGLTYKTSRISYIHNYFLIVLLLVTLLIIYPSLDLEVWWYFLVFLCILLLVVILFEEPEWERIVRKYMITNDEIIKIEGFLRKKRTAIPYQSIADTKVIKGILGRIFNFGDVEVTGFRDGIKMKGMKNPEEVYRIVQNKISIKKGKVGKGE